LTATSTLSSSETVELFQRSVVPSYVRYPVNLVRGDGSAVWDSEGREYLDLFPGWGCNLLGHCPPRVVKAVQHQVATLIHVPNIWHMDLQGQWAEMLCERGFGGQAFFCNSGAEANEAAIKLARLYGGGERFKIITFTDGFHGRTLATTTATAQPKYHEGLGPLIAGFRYAPFGDLEAVSELIDEQTVAILVEPIQGEGGINLPPPEFLPGLRQLADDNDLLLMFDEVQTGVGRTGNWFAYQQFGVTPDVMSLAKALCSGIAGAAMLTTHELAKQLRPGMHASTFGGNPIAAAAGIATMETIDADGLLERAGQIEQRFATRIEALSKEIDIIEEVRMLGTMIGIQLSVAGAPVVEECMRGGVLINCTQQTVIRLLPALTVSDDEIDRGCEVLSSAMKKLVA
jgi:acetylornithine/N-succinyldiaminopimelate aminotransferase